MKSRGRGKKASKRRKDPPKERVSYITIDSPRKKPSPLKRVRARRADEVVVATGTYSPSGGLKLRWKRGI